MEASERFEILNKFLGWGNPEDAIWFVGIEEGGGWSKAEYEAELKKDLTQKEYEEAVDRDIISNYNQNDHIKHCEKEDIFKEKEDFLYRNITRILKDERLANTNINNLFISNLYPLGVNSNSCEDWVKVFTDYKTIFELKNEEYQKDKYYDRASEDRFITLGKLREEHKPLLTICYGISHHLNFADCFKVKVIENKQTRGRCFISEDNTLIVVNHLSYSPNASLFINNHFDLIREKYINRIIE